MTTALAPEPQAMTQRPEIAALVARESEIAELAEKYLPLRINGINDKAGSELVHSARMKVKTFRVALEKKRVELKADALAYGRAVDGATRKMFGLLEPIEAHLQAEEDAVTEAKEKIKREAEEAKVRATQARFTALNECRYAFRAQEVAQMTDEQFAEELARAKAAEVERDRQEADAAEARRQEEAALAAERDRLARIKAEQDAEAARQKAESDRLAAERRQIEEREDEHRRQAELAKAREEAAEKARLETEQRLAREAAERKAAEEREAAEAKARAEEQERARLKAEAERPHREKLLAVAAQVEAIVVPEGPQSSAVQTTLRVAAGQIKRIANGAM